MFWNRHRGVWRSEYFEAKEFECKDGLCQSQIISDDLVADLDWLRAETGLPIVINEAYRCKRHQQVLRDAKNADGSPKYETSVGISSHETGLAADITLRVQDRTSDNWNKLRAAVYKRFEAYSIGESTSFFHVDRRPGGPRRWTYKS